MGFNSLIVSNQTKKYYRSLSRHSLVPAKKLQRLCLLTTASRPNSTLLKSKNYLRTRQLTSMMSMRPTRMNSFLRCILKSRSSAEEMMALMRAMQCVRRGSLFLIRRPWTIGENRSVPRISPAMVIASRVFSWPSGGTRQTAAISLTASSMTCGRFGVIDLASSVRASLCSNMSFKPTLLFM